jgi:hypothetical protein
LAKQNFRNEGKEMNNGLGFMVGEDYYVEFANENDFIEVADDGRLAALVNVYKITASASGGEVREEVAEENMSSELQERIEVALSTFLEAAFQTYIDKESGLDEPDFNADEIIIEDTTGDDIL